MPSLHGFAWYAPSMCVLAVAAAGVSFGHGSRPGGVRGLPAGLVPTMALPHAHQAGAGRKLARCSAHGVRSADAAPIRRALLV